MRKKAKAIAIVHPFHAALESAQNSANFILDFMYGTPERTRMTVIFACALAVLGFILQSTDAGASSVCPIG